MHLVSALVAQGRRCPAMLACGTLALAMVVAPASGGAHDSAPRSAKLRYTLTVTYTGRWHFDVVLGARNLVRDEKVSTWKASSVAPFTLERSGTRSKPRYRFSTKVVGTMDHRGSGLKRWLMKTPAGTFGPCLVSHVDSDTEGNTQVGGTVFAHPAENVVRFSGYDIRRPRPRVMTTTPAHTCPVTAGGKTITIPNPQKVERCKVNCPVMPEPWKQSVTAKAVRFGRAFTLKRFDSPITNPKLLAEITNKNPVTRPSLGTLPAGSIERAYYEYTYVLTFRPLSGSR